MSMPESERQEILSRIDQLLQEAYALPRSTESWERRLYIDWELFQLFRRFTGADAAEAPPAEQGGNPERKPRRLDRPAQLPF